VRAHAPKQAATRRQTAPSTARSASSLSPSVDRIQHMHRSLGNQWVLRSLRLAGGDVAGSPGSAGPPTRVHEVLSSAGRPLDSTTRSFMERRLGRSLESVRVHSDRRSEESVGALGARAYAVGRHLAFGANQYRPETGAGKRLIAHELAHTLQQASEFDPSIVRRDVEQAEPGEAEYRSFVQATIRVFAAAATRYSTVGPPDVLSRLIQEERDRVPPGGPLVTLMRDLAAIEEGTRRAAQGPQVMLDEIARILQGWRQTYDGAQRVVSERLDGDADLAERLRATYQQAIEALHRSARSQTSATRVNVNVIAAPPGPGGDEFIENAADYARAYYGSPLHSGDEVVTVEGVDSLDALFSAVEGAHPERMIRRVDIFAHGTINPGNQIRFGAEWNTAEEIQAAAAARRFRSSYIQSASRFDESSAMELHACRLGTGTGGHSFLETAGRALGGAHGQRVTGYTERWFPRRYQVSWEYTDTSGSFNEPVVNTANDIYGPNALPDRNGKTQDHAPFIARFENHAVQIFDQAMAGSPEVQTHLSAAERGGQPVTRDRKIQIMRTLYDADQAWVLGFQHAEADPPDVAPATAVGEEAYTFTSETEAWQSRTLTVTLEPPEAD